MQRILSDRFSFSAAIFAFIRLMKDVGSMMKGPLQQPTLGKTFAIATEPEEIKSKFHSTQLAPKWG